IEQKWISELPSSRFGDLSLYYENQEAFGFLGLGCGSVCLREFVDEKHKHFSIYALPLLNESSYWDSKISELVPQSLKDDRIPDTLDILFSARKVFQDNFDERLFFLSLSQQEFDSHEVSTMLSEAKQVFEDVLIPMDLANLQNVRVERSGGGQTASSISILYWLAEPKLSNRGAQLSSGPRPRITTLMGTGTSNTTTTTMDPNLGLLIPRPGESQIDTDSTEADSGVLKPGDE
ncbi:MAG: hypothetical protein AAF202_12040, partial [Pseudomonadota bacterium]